MCGTIVEHYGVKVAKNLCLPFKMYIKFKVATEIAKKNIHTKINSYNYCPLKAVL